MKKTKVELIKGDTRTLEFKLWSGWLGQAAMLLDRHISKWEDDDPFSYNETASVAFLAAAGALEGHVTLAECTTEKLSTNKRDSTKVTKRKRHGRADLWLHTTKKDWAFEFKQRLNVGVSRANGRLKSQLDKARFCAKAVVEEEDGHPVAGLIVSLYFIESDETAEKASKEIEVFVNDADNDVKFCWLLTPPEGRRPTYLLFDLI